MSGYAFRGFAGLIAAVLAASSPGLAQNAVPTQGATPAMPGSAAPAADTTPEVYTQEQLDALMAPIALYPDTLLTQIMMASTFPVEMMQARLWLDNPANRALKGDAIAKALEAQSWDPSVKSLVPFPQIVGMMTDKADWMQQLGYAVSVQQMAVLDSVQRLRRQAQLAGSLATTPQQTVTMTASSQSGAPPVIVVQPANPQVVYVPSYNPTQVYGAWPYPATPPVYLPPPPGYAIGNALVTGMAFAAGVAIVASLWNIGQPNWGHHGGMNVNVNRYNSVNVNRTQINNNNWRPPASGGYNRPGNGGANRPAGGYPAGGVRPPSGPVGMPGRGNGLPPNAIGRPSVSVPGGALNRPPKPPGIPGAGIPGAGSGGVGSGGSGINRPNPPGGANRPGNAGGSGVNRPAPPGGAGRPAAPNAGAIAQRPALQRPAPQRPAPQRPPVQRPAPQRPSPAALGGMKEGRQTPAFANRGAQSREVGGGGRNLGGARPGPGARSRR